ncbi:MAG: ATP-binding protein [Clostridia bacterium]|nr:ATP-binding protein [Clostridia bacterium]
MLLEFKMKNFKSFKEEMEFKMIPTTIKDLEYSIITRKIKGKEIKALSSAVIYGPNSSGKTNIIGGMAVLRSIVLNGNIKNKEDSSETNIELDKLELIPNTKNNDKEPVLFEIKFITQGILVRFKLLVELGNFLDEDYDRKIINEELYIDNDMVYIRNDKLKIGKIDKIEKYMIENFSEEVAEKIANSNLDKSELFLNGIFKTLYSKKIVDIINEWFKSKFKIIYHANRLNYYPIINTQNKAKKYAVNEKLNKALNCLGLESEEIVYPMNTDKKPIPLSVIDISKENKKAIVPAEVFESFGTIRFINMFPIISSAINTGATLVIDELDASMHPMVIMNIINIFHNDEINTKGAQLIFNTHNPIFLNNALFRRDEIKFVDKEENSSIHYSLSDFGTNGLNGVRNTEDYMKNYFINKYGAIRNIDFTNIFINDKEKNK